MNNNFRVDYYYNKIKSFASIKDDIWRVINSYFSDISDFNIDRQIQWIHVNYLSSKELTQGWKIHVSATYLTAIDILKCVSEIVLNNKVSFKVTDTISTLKVMNDSHYPRGYSGKFITIYPDSTEQFVELVKCIHSVTRSRGLTGPVILSDKRFKDGIVFYRYGGFKAIYNGNDHKKLYIYDPDGNLLSV